MSMKEQYARYFAEAMAAGFTYDTANAIRRDAQRIHTIAVHECNGVLERVEEDGRVDHRGRPMIVGAVYSVSNINGPGPLRYYRTADRETGCRRRIDSAAAELGGTVEYQGDPRGWPVTIRVAGRELCPPVRG